MQGMRWGSWGLLQSGWILPILPHCHMPRSGSRLSSNHLEKNIPNASLDDISKAQTFCVWEILKSSCFNSLLERNEGNVHQNKKVGACNGEGTS